MEYTPDTHTSPDLSFKDTPTADDLERSLILPDHTVFNPDTSFSLELNPSESGIDASIWTAATQHEELTRQYRRKVYHIMQTLRASVTGNHTTGLESQGAELQNLFEQEKEEMQQEYERKIAEIVSGHEKEKDGYQQKHKLMEKMVVELNASRVMWRLICANLLVLPAIILGYIFYTSSVTNNVVALK